MIRSLVRPVSKWVGMHPATHSGGHSVRAMRHPFHSSTPAYIGFKNFKNAPVLNWKLKRELEAKDKEAEAGQESYVPYAKAIKTNRKAIWLGARKKIDHSRLFGEGGGSSAETKP